MKIPCVEQHDSSDCGVACVVSICLYYGKYVTIAQLRDIMGTDAYGTTIDGLNKGLQSLGFDSRPIYISSDSFAHDDFTLPAIARLVREDGTAHYVAVYSIKRNRVFYMDPDTGKVVKKTLDEFNEDFDGGLIMMIPKEEFIRTREKSRTLFGTFSKMMKAHKGLFIMAIIMSVLITIFGILIAMFNKTLVDEIIPYQEDNQLLLFGIVLIAIVCTNIIVSAFRSHMVLYLSQKVDIPLMLGYFDHVFKLPIRFFESRRTGDIVTRFQDAGTVKDILTNTALTVVIDAAMVIIVGVVLAVQSLDLFWIVLIMAILSSVLMFAFRAPYKKLNRKSMEQNARLNSQIIESLNNVATIKTNVSEEHSMEKIETEFIKSLRIQFDGGVLNNIQSSLSGAITNIGNLALILFGGYLTIQGTITLGTLMAFTSLAGYFIDPIGRLIGMQLSIQEADISLKRLSEIYDIDEENEIEDGKDLLEDPIEDVEVSDVTFGYGTRPPVLEGVNIHIGKGEKVAIVGRSGCGKTTLSKLILKFYSPQSGTVKINGRNIEEIDSFSLRKHIGCVPQDIRTFSGSLRENLLLGGYSSKEEMDRACEIAGCTEFIKRLPAGYDTFLDETGGGLSGGEKQRLILARAILRNPDFLIMDEATSNMDYVTEKTTFDLIFKKLADCPMLIIAHRLSTIRNCDRIYMMDSGKVVESGTHDELLALHGAYYELWSTQTGEINVGEKKSEETRIMERDETTVGYEEPSVDEAEKTSEEKKTNDLDEIGEITYE
ncbi:MAG: peptidase domain-containing ABC transporter [Candidatus Methanomethylophilaceae archaeon]|nr:peptidase domain-containing ABC transporter [Candidatus Methanomethylophilaceae archaeon]